MTQDLFLEIYDKYKNTVYSVIFNYVKNVEDTADLQQEVFIKLFNNQTEYENDEHIKAWLIRVSANMSKNHLRNKKHVSDEPFSEDIPFYDKKENDDLVKEVLALPEKYRIPIHLFYYEDYSIKQISEVLETPEATVKVRLKRGREKLKKSLKKEDWL
ncbi:MAG: sigma-70 family RNA polymerase sigma factor [Lachnospiraceae bacterium]|nr:sigma-70 family RNA polymerase sigma factor [Lachnospiraceae bacterium]